MNKLLAILFLGYNFFKTLFNRALGRRRGLDAFRRDYGITGNE